MRQLSVPSHFDTIIAPITGVGRAAVAIVRLSGAEAWSIGAHLFPSLPPHPEAMRLYYGRFVHGDDGYLALFEDGRSYTGEPSAECSIHGSPVSVRCLVEAAQALGARFAEPGEFTQRAFLNGRIDLTQAEAVRDTIEAQTEAQLRAANNLRDGVLYRRISKAKGRLESELVAIEASVDFSEEIGPLDRVAAADRLDELVWDLKELVVYASRGRILRRGLRVAILGRPNAGKSTLMNALLGTDRSIVAPNPGTTRDYIEELFDLDGLPVVLIDTAGLRESEDEAEAEGVRRSQALAANADLVFYVYDSAVGWRQEDDVLLGQISRANHVLANKADLAIRESDFGVAISAATGSGIDEVRRLVKVFAGEMPEIALTLRHVEPLMRAAGCALNAWQTMRSERPVDLASVALREAISALGEVTGETTDPDVIARIFHDFCIGK